MKTTPFEMVLIIRDKVIAKDLLKKIGFSLQMQDDYRKFRAIADEKIALYAKDYVFEKMTMEEAKEKLDATAPENMSIYTVHLLFVLECTGFLEEEYKKRGIPEDIFINSMRDILFKTKECGKRYGVFGIEPFCWFNGFFRLKRLALGRLQFDVSLHEGEPIKLKNYTVNEGGFVLRCHIPSAGPLTYDLRLDSYKRAYNFHKDKLKDGILVIRCDSYLLYPKYAEVFGEKSNTADFRNDFEMFDFDTVEIFNDAWRIFYMDFNGDTSVLPQETSLQKAFVKYLNNNPTFGHGSGIILFDGEKILTRK